MTDVTRVLTRARTFVESGWVQGTGMDPEGNVCTAQALVNAVNLEHCLEWIYPTGTTAAIRTDLERSQEHNKIQMLFMEAIKEMFPAGPTYRGPGGVWLDIPEWNDTPGRTIEEVLDTFDRALKIAERDS